MLYNKINEDEVRIYNRKTGEMLCKCFQDPIDADEFEFVLDFLGAEYERYHNGVLVFNEPEYLIEKIFKKGLTNDPTPAIIVSSREDNLLSNRKGGTKNETDF